MPPPSIVGLKCFWDGTSGNGLGHLEERGGLGALATDLVLRDTGIVLHPPAAGAVRRAPWRVHEGLEEALRGQVEERPTARAVWHRPRIGPVRVKALELIEGGLSRRSALARLQTLSSTL